MPTIADAFGCRARCPQLRRLYACRGLQAQLLDGLLAHQVFLYLAGDGHGESVHEFPVDGDLEGRDLALAELRKLVAGRHLALFEPHPRHELLAILEVWHTHDLDVADLGVRVQELFDLARIDVFATANHHVLQPPDDVDVAVVVHRRQVACVHPARGVYRLACRFVVIPVAEHHGIAARQQLAWRAGGKDAAGVCVHQLDLDMRGNLPNPRDAPFQGIV